MLQKGTYIHPILSRFLFSSLLFSPLLPRSLLIAHSPFVLPALSFSLRLVVVVTV